MTSHEKVATNKMFTRNEQNIDRKENKPLKRQNYDPGMRPNEAHYFIETSEVQILNINSAFPEIFPDFLNEE